MPQEAPVEPNHPKRFARVECPDCGNKQVLFVRAATSVNCLVCATPLAHPTGGVADIEGEIDEYIE